MKVALVYDRVNKWGGAERVLLALKKIFPDAPLYTSVYNSRKASWAKVFSIRTSFLQKFPRASSSHELLATLMPLAFESLRFDEYDLVISVTSESAKGIHTGPNTLHICYCLTPTRYLWSGYNEYFEKKLLKIISSPAVSYLKIWDKLAARRPDVMIAISKEVQKRIKKYYGRSSHVIYPPLTLTLKPKKVKIKVKKSTQPFYLVVSRLVPYKRVDIAIEACNKLKLPLVVVGKGSEEAYLRSIAGPTIKFVGTLSDDKLTQYYYECKALLFCGKEDFGLVMVEAQSYGKPVIAYKAGGAKEIVLGGKTGELFTPQTSKALGGALAHFRSSMYNSSTCRKQARQFSFDIFKKELLELINISLAKNKSI